MSSTACVGEHERSRPHMGLQDKIKPKIIQLRAISFIPWRTNCMWRRDGLRQKGYLGADSYKNIDIDDVLMAIWWRGMDMCLGYMLPSGCKEGRMTSSCLALQGRVQPSDESQHLSGRLTRLHNRTLVFCLLTEEEALSVKVNLGTRIPDLSSWGEIQNAWSLDKGKLISLHPWELVPGFPAAASPRCSAGLAKQCKQISH